MKINYLGTGAAERIQNFCNCKLCKYAREKKDEKFVQILYLIFDYPHKHYTFKYFEV